MSDEKWIIDDPSLYSIGFPDPELFTAKGLKSLGSTLTLEHSHSRQKFYAKEFVT